MSAAAFLVAAICPLAPTAWSTGHRAAAADEVSAIFAKHAEYVGHPQGLVLAYRYAPKATPASAKADKDAEPDTVVTYRRGALYHRVGGDSAESGFTGRAFWSSNENGYTVVNYEDSARRKLTHNLIEGDLLDAGVPAELRGAQTIDGVLADVVRIKPAQGIPADVAFSRATGAYVQVTYDPEHDRTPLRYDGYTEVAPGVRVPSGYHYSDSGSYKLTEHTVRAVTNDDLRGPVPTAKWNFVSSDAVPIEIAEHQSPYSFSGTGHAVHVHATIGGHPGTFLLDSGASGVVIYRPYADKLKYKKLGSTEFSGVNGGTVAAGVVRLEEPIEVGKNTLSNLVVTVADPQAPGAAGEPLTSHIDGILGYDFLAGALVDVDTANRTLRILDPSAMQPVVGQGAYAFTVNLSSRQPEIALKVSGVPTRAIFDTGDDYLAVLSDDLVSSRRIVALPDQINLGGGQKVDYQISFNGVDGVANIPVKCSRLGQLDVGPYKYVNVETCFASANVFGRDGGLIGFDFLKHFNWTFDYAESKLVLTPNGK